MASSPRSRPHRRSPGKRRTALVSAAVVAAVAVAVSLVVALRPDGETKAVASTAAPAAATTRSATPHSTPTQKPKPTPEPTSTPEKPKPTKASPTPTPRPASASAPLAGRIRPGVDYKGTATFYDAGDGDGACLFGPTDDVMTAAMNTTDYETSKACGAYVQVRAASGATVTVRITNECPLPCAPGQLDLSAQAFARLAAPVTGQIPITWRLLSPAVSEKISVRYKTGSSRYWCEIQAVGHRNPLARLEVRTAGGWQPLTRTEYNYFLSEQGAGCGAAIRLTDIYGETLTVDGLAIRPDVAQPTGVQFAAH
ncbi:expansin EXLX1 family cellulose-binding protein [Streptomyces chartreusis]|uniref:expansin EXLX1 family cellulose-binding protein n=1 Tax=Streptomyces chartreusis TaxID=1969 RepID=UPI003870556A|nr:expansin EXLX1 family cellulose-binding protein [Streptomyces chartreusis]